MNEREPAAINERILDIRGNEVKLVSKTGAKKPVCAVLQPLGTFSHEAAIKLLDDQVYLTLTPTNEEVVNEAKSAKVDVAIVATENSTAGFVNESTYRILENDNDLTILAEEIIPISHNIFGTNESFAKGVIRSHKKAFEQCRKWLSHHPELKTVEESSTAEAVKIAVSNGELSIGPKAAGAMYGASLLEQAVEDFKGNATRFWLIGSGETEPTGNDRTTMFFELKDSPNYLVSVLKPFADRNLNVKPITLIHGEIDQYKFLLHVDGHLKDPDFEEAYKVVTSLKVFDSFRLLGSYQRAKKPQLQNVA